MVGVDYNSILVLVTDINSVANWASFLLFKEKPHFEPEGYLYTKAS